MKVDFEINYPDKVSSSVAVHFHEHGDCGDMGNNAHGQRCYFCCKLINI